MRNSLLELIIRITTQGQQNLANANTQTQQMRDSVGNLGREFGNLKNTIAVIIGGRFGIGLFRDLIQSANQASMAVKGLEYTAIAFGQSQSQVTAAARELAQDGLISLKDSAEGLKFLLASGFNVSEALQIGKSFKDIGAFNNVVGDLGQAFKDSAKGIKTGSIELIENIGFTQRLSTVMKQANIDISQGIDITNNLGQRRALLNAITVEGGKFQGNANKLAADGVGAQNKLATSFETLKASLGGVISVAITPFIKTLTEDIKSLNDALKNNDSELRKSIVVLTDFLNVVYQIGKGIGGFVINNFEAVKTIGLLAGSAWIATKAAKILYSAFESLKMLWAGTFVITPVGAIAAVLTAFSVAAGYIFAHYAKQKAALEDLKRANVDYANIQNINIKKLQDEHYWNLKKAESLESLIKKYEDLKKEGKDNTSAQTELKKVLKQIQENYPELVMMTNQYGDAMRLNVEAAKKMAADLKKLKAQEIELLINDAEIKKDKVREKIEEVMSSRSWKETLLPGEHTVDRNTIPGITQGFYKSVWNDPEKRIAILEGENTYRKLDNQIDLLEMQLKTLKQTDTAKYKPSPAGKPASDTSATKTTAIETAEANYENWFVMTMKKQAAASERFDKWKTYEKSVNASGDIKQQTQYYSKYYDMQKETVDAQNKYNEELEETLNKIKLLNTVDETERKKIEIDNKTKNEINKIPDNLLESEKNSLTTALNNEAERQKEKIQAEADAALKEIRDKIKLLSASESERKIIQIDMDAEVEEKEVSEKLQGDEKLDAVKVIKNEAEKKKLEIREEAAAAIKEVENQIRLFSAPNETERRIIQVEIDAEKEIKDIPKESSDDLKRKKTDLVNKEAARKKLEIEIETENQSLELQKEKQKRLEEYLKESQIFKYEIEQRELADSRDAMLNEYQYNEEMQNKIKLAYQQKFEDLKIQYKDFEGFTTAQLNKMLENEKLNAGNREALQSEFNERLKRNNVSGWEAFKNGWNDAGRAFKTQLQIMQELGAELNEKLNSGLSTFIQESIKNIHNMKEAWKNFSASMRDVFVKAIADMLVAQMKLNMTKGIIKVVSSIFGGGTAAASQTGDVLQSSGDMLTAAGGGWIGGAGTGTSDSNLALLSKGEFVVRAVQAKKHRTLLENINSGTIERYADGGSVGGAAGSKNSSANKPESETAQPLNIYNLFDADAFFMAGFARHKKDIINFVKGEAILDRNLSFALQGKR